MSELGELLKTRREELDKSFRSIYQDTKIREQHIRIIENGAFGELPSYLHAYGFVKKYAEYLGLDYVNVVKPLFDFEFPKHKKPIYTLNPQTGQEELVSDTTNNEHTTVYSPTTTKRKNLLFAGVFVISAIALFFAYHFIFSSSDVITERDLSANNITLNISTLKDEEVMIEDANNYIEVDNQTPTAQISQNSGLSLIPEEQTTEITDERKKEVAKMEATERLIEQNKAQAEAKDTTPKRLLLSFTEDCWIQYTADSYPPVEYYGLMGQSKTVMFVDNFTIDIGNASGLSFSYGRQKFSNFGNQGAVLKGLRYRIVDGILTKEVN